jgi:phospholipase C
VPKGGHDDIERTSVLKLIEWRFGLDPLTARDASNEVRNLAWVLRLRAPPFDVPPLPHPTAPRPRRCLPWTTGRLEDDDTWGPLLECGLLDGWPVEL